jgi:23S rRNA pseudouridine2605 synthase
MAFNRPGNGRDGKSGTSSNRGSKAGDRPKRATSSRGNSVQNSDSPKSTRPSKKYNSEAPGEKRSFSSGGRGGSDKPASSFSGGPGEKKSFTPKSRPYTGRPSEGGEGKSFSKSRPYTGRTADNDARPGKSSDSYRSGGERTGDKKPFNSRSKSTGSFGADRDGDKKPFGSRGRSSGSSFSDERPKKSFGDGDKKPFTSRGKSSGSFNADDKPKRTFGSDRGDKKFSGRPSSGAGFKRSGGDKPYDADRPQHRSQFDKTPGDRQDAPERTMRGRKKAAEPKDDGLIRLNRYISNAGICSRRKADELIEAGVVSVNGVVVSELGHKVDPAKDEIRYNGELLKREKMVYVLLNKPKDYITTTEDPQERRTVMHLVEKASRERIYPVGRLDRNTTGLLLMTNDGDLADKLSHPRNNIVKLYQVELSKSHTQGDLNKISFGLELEDGLIKPDSISYVAGGSKREVGIQIHSGKNRIVRRIFEHLGYEVVKLDRAVYANLTKKDLPRGRWRFLEEKEVIQLKHLV